MTTWSTTEYLNSAGYTPSYHATWSQYTIVLIAGDTLNVRTIYNGGDSNAASINYITSPNNSSTVNDPDPSTSQTGLDRTWSSSSFSNSNHHTRWYWFTSGTVAQKSVRILTIPTTFGWNNVQASIEQGSSASATLYVPSSFAPYIQGTASETGDTTLSTNGSYNERFHWRITPSSSSNSLASGFSTSSGYFSGPSHNASITISPTTSASAGTYYLKLYYHSPTGTTAGNTTLIDTISFSVTALVPLDTNISLTSSRIVVGNTSSSYTQGLTGGGSNTIYYILNANNLANGSNIDALRTGGDSRYVARTYDTGSSRSFRTAASGSYTITANLPSTGTTDTYYVYAANGTGENSTLLSNTYTVDRPDVSISLTPSTTTLSSSNTSDVTVNVTGDTSGTQFRLYTNDIPRWISTYNGGSSNTNDFTIAYSESELPTAGNSYTYFSQARVPYGSGGVGWINTNDSFTISRSVATTYSVSASPTSINEGQSTTWTVTYSGITSARTVNYTISGINSNDLSSGSLTGSFSISSGSGTATTSVTLQNDSATEGTETATLTLDSTDSTGASTGSPSASVTIADTSNQGGSSGSSGSIGGGSAENFGLAITNVAGTSVIINNNSRLGTFLSTASVTISDTNTSGQLFTSSSNGGAIDCSDSTIIGMHTIWTGSAWLHPAVTRNSSTGITVTRLSSTASDPNNFWGGTLTISLIRY